MNRKDEMTEIRQLVGMWLNEIALENAETYYDINKVSEHLCRKLMNLIYGYELIDLNKIKVNFPGLDIGDETVAKIAYQVTSRTDRQKIIDNLKSVVGNNYQHTFTAGIKFLILSATGRVEFTAKSKLPSTVLSTFNINDDIVYPDDLVQKIEDIYEKDDDLVRFTAIKLLLSKELAPRFKSLALHQQTEEANQLKKLLKSAIAKIENSGDSTFKVSSQFFEGDLTVPVIKPLHFRENLVNYFLNIVNQRSVLWVQGPISTGKTSSIVSLAGTWGNEVLWVECRGIPESQLLEHVISSLATYFNLPLERTFRASLIKLADQLASNTLIVLNDIPQLSPGLTVKDHLSYFIGQMIAADGKVILTSNFLPPNDFGEADGFDTKAEIIPPFETEDTESLLLKMGASAELSGALSKLITTSTQGHPLLIKAAIKYLKERDWKVNGDLIVSIFAGTFDLGPDRAVYQKLIDQTATPESRELIYRLKYIVGSFDNTTINRLAAIHPPIKNPAEQINDLLGSWIQQNKEGQYQISPLVKKLDDNISPDLKSKVYVELAKVILERKNISIIDASAAILYYQFAGENNKAAVVLIQALTAITTPQMFKDWGLNLYWYTTELPNDMAPMFKAQIRVAQLNLTEDDDAQVQFLSADLKKISEEKGGGEFEKLLAAMQFFQADLRINPLQALDNFLQLKSSSQKIDKAFKLEEPIINEQMLNGVWLVFAGLTSIGQYREWFEKVHIQEYASSIKDPELNDAYAMAAASMYRNVILQATEAGNAETLLEELITLSIAKEIWLFAGYAIKYLVKLHALNNKLDLALTLVKKYESLLEKSYVYKFLVYTEVGRQAHLLGEPAVADQFVKPLLGMALPGFYTEMLDFYMTATQLYFESDPQLADKLAQAGLDLVISNPIYVLEDKIKQHGEAAIAKTLVDKNREALIDVANGFELVLDNFQESDEFKAQIIRFGHVAMYIVQLLDLGKARDFGTGEKFVIPVPGFFYRDTDLLLQDGFYFDERKSMVATIINDGFEVIFDKENAKRWAYKTFDLALSVPNGIFTPILQKIVFYLIEDQEYKKAYNVLAYIEQFYQRVIARVTAGDGTAEEIELVDRANKTRVTSDDLGVYLHILFPAALEFSRAIIAGQLVPENFQKSIDAVFDHGQYVIADPDEFETARRLFERIMIERIGYAEMKAMVDALSGSNKDIVYAIGCYLLSTFSNAQEAANLQLATLVTIDKTFSTNLKAFYRFSMVPYFEEFWIRVFNDRKTEFTQAEFLLSKGIALIQKTDFDLRIAKIFQVMANHLKFNMSAQIEDFIDPDK